MNSGVAGELVCTRTSVKTLLTATGANTVGPSLGPDSIGTTRFIAPALLIASASSQNQTNDEWTASTRKKFQDPHVILKNYGGHQLDFLAQIELSLSCGDGQVNSIVIMRKGSPNNHLIGTDVQPKLGLTLVAENDDRGMTDLCSGQQNEYWPSRRETRVPT